MALTCFYKLTILWTWIHRCRVLRRRHWNVSWTSRRSLCRRRRSKSSGIRTSWRRNKMIIRSLCPHQGNV